MMKLHNSTPWLFYLLLAPLWAGAQGDDSHQWQSGRSQNVMIELYTSEGCSSCPPAERRLNEYQQHPQLWQRYFPMAFHVDYWNYLGWEDRFSRQAYSERQRRYARAGGVSTIYTPAFVVNGKAWRPGFFSAGEPDPSARETGILKWHLRGKQWQAQYDTGHHSTGQWNLNLVVLGMDLNTDIRAGENRGRQAHHDFVVLHYQSWSAEQPHWQGRLPQLPSSHVGLKDTRQLAVVVWVSRAGHPAPLQVVGGYIPVERIIKNYRVDH